MPRQPCRACRRKAGHGSRRFRLPRSARPMVEISMEPSLRRLRRCRGPRCLRSAPPSRASDYSRMLESCIPFSCEESPGPLMVAFVLTAGRPRKSASGPGVRQSTSVSADDASIRAAASGPAPGPPGAAAPPLPPPLPPAVLPAEVAGPGMRPGSGGIRGAPIPAAASGPAPGPPGATTAPPQPSPFGWVPFWDVLLAAVAGLQPGSGRIPGAPIRAAASGPAPGPPGAAAPPIFAGASGPSTLQCGCTPIPFLYHHHRA
jgi:hypothetical protein